MKVSTSIDLPCKIYIYNTQNTGGSHGIDKPSKAHGPVKPPKVCMYVSK